MMLHRAGKFWVERCQGALEMPLSVSLRKPFLKAAFVALCLFGTLFFIDGFGQVSGQTTKVLANTITYTSGKKPGLCITCPTVINANNALTDNENYARLLASPGIGGLGSYTGAIELRFPSILSANTTSYVRIGGQEALLNSLLGGSLGNLLSGLLGTVLFGNQIIGVDARLGGVSVNQFPKNSSSGFTTDAVRLIQDANGNYYLKITPTQAYDRIRITNSSSTALLGQEYELNIFNVFHFTGSEPTCESTPSYTGFDGAGLTLDLLGSNPPVSNPERSIDGNTSNYSEVGLTALGIGATVHQEFYFQTLSQSDSKLNVRLQISSETINLNLLGDFRIKAFNGTTEVFNQPLSGGFIGGIDVLGILNTGGIVTVPLDVHLPFDRVEIGLTSTLNLATGAAIRIYGVSRSSDVCPDDPPTESPLNAPVCVNSSLRDIKNTDDAQNAVDGDFDSYATVRSDDGILFGFGSKEGFLEVEFDNPVPIGRTVLTRISYDDDVLNTMLGGTLGKITSDLVSGVLLGNHYFDIELKNGNTVAFSTSSRDNFSSSNGQVKIVQDVDGRYYISINSSIEFDRIRLIDRTSAAVGLLSPENQLRVYNICYDQSDDPCDPLQTYTSFSGSGLSLDLLGLSNLVNNPHRTIDSDLISSSEISLGLLGVGASTEQLVYFSSPVKPGNDITISLATDWSVLNLSLLEAFEFVVYSNGLPQETIKASSILGLDLLGLLEDGSFQQFPIQVDYPVDRIGVKISSLIDLNVLNSLKFSGVTVLPSAPEMEEEPIGGEYIICEGDELTLEASSPGNFQLTWYANEDDVEDDAISTTNSYNVPSELAPGYYTYYVRSSSPGCNNRSLPTEVNVRVVDVPEDLQIDFPGGIYDELQKKYIYQAGLQQIVLSPEEIVGGGVFKWFMDDEVNIPLDVSQPDANGAVFSVDDVTGTLTIGNTSQPVEYYEFYLVHENVLKCKTIKKISLENFIILPSLVHTFNVQAKEGRQVGLVWELSNEQLEGSVMIQRASSNLEFAAIGSLPVATGVEKIRMEFTDQHPLPGRNYYRLFITKESEGSSFYSEIRMAEIDSFGLPAFVVFPNSFVESFTVESTIDLDVPVVASLLNASGVVIRQLRMDRLSYGERIEFRDLSNLPEGIYILRMETARGSKAYRVIKQNGG